MSLTKIKSLLINNGLSKFWFYCLSGIIFFIVALPYFPSTSITQLFEYSIYLAPRWILFISLLPIFVFWGRLTKVRRVIFFVYVLFLIYFQDINFNLPSKDASSSSIKLLSLNMGGGSNSKYLKTLIKNENPDVFLFQETYIQNINSVFVKPWQYQCDAGLCIASKYPFNKIDELSRRVFKGWGNFAVYYEVNINGKILPLMNVHLETPRYILSDLIGLSINMQNISKFRENKSLELSLITTWADSQPLFIMSGDFNMTTSESLYQDYLSSYKNAIDNAGFGINFTKYTAWHGVRIDHTLTSNDIHIERADVMPSLGGDHRAIMTTVTLPSQ